MIEGRYAGTNVGNYSLKELIGSGTYGEVYRAEHMGSGKIVALKLMINRPPRRSGFLNEAQTLLVLRHEHILPLLDFDPEGTYIVTEYASNGTLEKLIEKYKPQVLPLADALSIITQIGKALQYAHTQNIVHRDLKPSNILFGANNQVLLADLGVAMPLETGGGTVSIDVIEGTLQYMAPEQFEGQVSARSDQYALGCLAYELITGEKAVEAYVPSGATPQMARDIWRLAHMNTIPEPPRRRLNKDLPDYAQTAILTALSKDRGDRYKSIGDFIAALKGTGSLPKLDIIKGTSIWRNEGHNHFKNKRYVEALIAFDNAIQLDPDDAANYISKGNALRDLRRFREALDVYNKASEVASPANKDISYVNMGHIHFELKSFDDALKFYEMANRISPDKEIFYVFMGNVYREKGEYGSAIRMYDYAIRRAKTGIVAAKALTGKGVVLLVQKAYPEALKAFKDSLERNPHEVAHYIEQSKALWKSSLYKEAAEVYEKGLRIDPGNAELRDMLAALKRSGKVK